ncbi:nuclear pore complex protein Nup50 [Rhagoletis pomonella]|uniref:nuclear pore complex protein Nup50 n=1 Tax=Rhagoletis pomonella TaxID=28610 RepID=UPI00177E3BDF|nr:nuclear pore complex protein Nup50 [Rhagoletis pomonella]
MSGKRQATSNLNHENWDQEDEPEERGTFRKASEDVLNNRVIKKARRKVATGTVGADSTDDGAPKSVFSGFAGFGKATGSTASASPFSFLTKISAPPADSTNPTDTSKATQLFSFGTVGKTSSSFDKKDTTSVENGNNAKGKTNDNIGKSSSYQSKIRCLNQAVSEWIKTHVDQNPLCILSPIFKDYEKYLSEIEEEEKSVEKLQTNIEITDDKKITSDAAPSVGNFKFSLSPAKSSTTIASTSTAGPKFSFGPTSPPEPTSTSSTSTANISKSATDKNNTNTFSFGIKTPENQKTEGDAKTISAPKGFSFGFKSDDKPSSTPFTFGKPAGTNEDSAKNKPGSFSFTPGSTPFSFGNIKPPTAIAASTSEDVNEADDEDQPPKVEFKQVVEDDAEYSKKCKVFVKKDGTFVDRGVGVLYLKPVKNSEKTQLLVRADTNLGNILVNLILSEGIPTQRMGKNNVMMVCLPTPDVEKATSMLLRVKTAEEADELLAELEKRKK